LAVRKKRKSITHIFKHAKGKAHVNYFLNLSDSNLDFPEGIVMQISR